ncbi:uncharacterized protein LOC129761620 [Toxorhynchites rutilus septentrionalis]|uniref:uncharacterized protein LOC129761620 n=1 Tax=Toxorhynchites rutilus septentrionalis TaxID=329112 RepID=UPI002479E51C|nr:uncharacterized protein LOC129761620 [Toxorhynchites rutilus septentrionalis]
MPNTTTTTKTSPFLKRLLLSLKDAHSTINDIWKFVSEFKGDTATSQAEVRLETLNCAWEKFSETLLDIKCHDEFDDEDDFYEQEKTDSRDRFYHAKAFLMEILKKEREQSMSTQSIRVNDSMLHGTFDHVRLPQIRLQTFDGNIDEWLSFRDLYVSLIHCKSDLPDVEKFHYLKGCLQGEPKALVDPLQLTGANYTIAWEMLLSRYNNSKLLKKRQIQSLFKLPIITKESASELHVLLDNFERVVKMLDQIVNPEDYRDLLLINILTTRLDPTTRRGWEEISASKEQESLADLTDFLHCRVQMLDSLPPRTGENKASGTCNPPLRHHPSFTKPSYSTVQTNTTRCLSCEAYHSLYQCDVFQRMTVSDRDSFLKAHSLCRNCFRAGHRARLCLSRNSCRKCGGRHHTLVCFRGETESATTSNSASSVDSPAVSIASSSQVANTAATNALASGVNHRYASQILLATAIVIVIDDDGNRYPVRALLDSGSESNFISERISQKLKVHRHRADISVLGIAESTTNVKQTIDATV